MTHLTRAGLTAATFLLLSTLVTLGDDWTAAKLRGRVLQLVDQQWQPLQRGDIVPDSHVIRTMAGAQVQLTRGEETVDVGPDTQIQIFDKPTGGKPFTTVKQYFGTVSVEAQVEQVQHFAVQTAYLAAVVKGTRFTVKVGRTGASVSVQRGHVAVEDKGNKSHVTLSVGQSAVVDIGKTDGALEVAGAGLLPIVLDQHGKPIDTKASGKGPKAPKGSADPAAASDPKAAPKGKDKDKADSGAPGAKADKTADKADKEMAKSNSSNGGSGGQVNGSSGSGDGGKGNGGGGGDGKGKDKKDK